MSKLAELLVKAEDDANNSKKWFELGRYAVDRYVIGVGLQAMRKAALLESENPDILDYFGRALNRARKLDEAAQVYDRAIKLAPERASIWTGYAIVQLHLGNVSKSGECFKRALDLDPGFPWAVLGYTTHLGISGQSSKIISVFKKAVEVNPNSSQNWAYLADTLEILGDSEGCKVGLSEAINRLKESPPDEHRRVLSMMVRSKRSNDAIRLAKEIIKEDPDNLGVYGPMISWCVQNDPGEGKRLLDYALSIDPNNSSIKPDGARLLLKTGNIRGALGLIESIRQDMPDSPVTDLIMSGLPEDIQVEQQDDSSLQFLLLAKQLEAIRNNIETFKIDKHMNSLQEDQARKEARHVIDSLRGLYSTYIWHIYINLFDKEGWSFVRERMLLALKDVEPEDAFLLKVGILDSLEMVEFAGYDGDLAEVLKTVSDNIGKRDVTDKIYRRLVEAVKSQIENGGPTLFLDVERLAYTEGASLIPMILTARKKELEKARVRVVDKTANLAELWKTSYGFDIITALEIGLSTDMYGLERIKTSMEDINLPLKIDNKDKISGISVSEALWKFISRHAERTDENE